MLHVWEREVSAEILAVLGETPLVVVAFDGRIPVCGSVDGALLGSGHVRPTTPTPLAGGRLPYGDATQPAVLVSFVGVGPSGADRRHLLAETRRTLALGGQLLLLDHNRPRRWLAAMGALVVAPVPPGATPGARWRRLGYTTAREAQGQGFTVQALRLAGRERVQLVIARVDAAAESTTMAGA